MFKIGGFQKDYGATLKTLIQKYSFISDDSDTVRQPFEVILYKQAAGLGMSLVGGGEHGKSTS